MRKLELYWKILIGMLFGVVFALITIQLDGGKEWIVDWVKPFGTLFINVLKLIAIPLILASLVKGISDLKDISKLSTMGIRTISLYVLTTILAVTIGLFVVNLIKPGESISDETRTGLMSSYETEVEETVFSAEVEQSKGPLEFLIDIIPENLFHAASSNGNMLQIIFFAIFFGLALVLIPEERGKPVKQFFDSLNDVILKMIDLIMIAAPYGVFALLASLVAEAPSQDLFIALLWYAFCVLVGLVLLMLLYFLILWIFVKRTPRQFIRGIGPAQLLGFSTSSSAATLPLTMERVEDHLGVDNEVSSFVLPIGATINMDGTSLYQAVAAVFIAQAFGMDLDFSTQLGIVVTTVLASIGTAAVPGAGIVMLVIVLNQAGIPEAGLALILAIDRPLDMCRTVINITGDAMVSLLIAKRMGKLEDPELKNSINVNP